MSSATSSATPSGRRSWQGSSPLPETGICIVNILCRPWRHHESALSFDAEKEGAGCDASVTGWRIGLILRAPCSAAPRTLPRKTTCGGFWYFWPQKYMNNLFSFPLLFGGEKQQQKFSRKPFAIFGLLAENFFFFLCFSVSKSSKSHPTDSDAGVRTPESGVGRLRGFASKPSPPLALSAARPLFRHRNQVGNRLAEKEKMELRGWLVLRNKSDTQPEAGRTSKLIRASRAHCIIMPPLAAQ